MQKVFRFLRFTTEVGEGEGKWLPTLDLKLRVEKTNQISYRFYEKPSTTNVMMQKRSSLDENSKVQILSNDLERRLAHTDDRQERSVMSGVVDSFGKKLLTSGYSLKQVRTITMNGIRGWERRKIRAREEGRSIFRTSQQSMAGRIKKRTIGKTSWFKQKRTSCKKTGVSGEEMKPRLQEERIVKSKKPKLGENKLKNQESPALSSKTRREVETAAVLFVEGTKESKLAKELKDVVEKIKHILGYRIKIVERSGTPLKLMFPLSGVGEGGGCSRKDCVTCTQEGRGEHLPRCTKRNVLYENICTLCNPGVGEEKKGKKLTPPTLHICG